MRIRSKPILHIYDSDLVGERFVSVSETLPNKKKQIKGRMTPNGDPNTKDYSACLMAPPAGWLGHSGSSGSPKGWMPQMLPGKKNKSAALEMYQSILDWESCLRCSYRDFKGSFQVVC